MRGRLLGDSPHWLDKAIPGGKILFVRKEMILQKFSVWVAILSAALVSSGCYLLAGELGRTLQYRGSDLQLLAQVFYPDALLIYLFPVPLGVWASIYSFKGKVNDGHGLLLIATTFGVT